MCTILGVLGTQQCTESKLPASMEVTFVAKEEEQRKFQKIQRKAPPVTAMMAGGVCVSGKVLRVGVCIVPHI